MIHTKAKTFQEVLKTAKYFAKKHNQEYYIICGRCVEYFSAFYPFAIYSAWSMDVENVDYHSVEAIVYPNGEVESWR